MARSLLILAVEEAEFVNLYPADQLRWGVFDMRPMATLPDVRPVNLGEILFGDNSRSKLKVTTNLQAFALI